MMKNFMHKAANLICALAVVIAPVAARHCACYFYEAKEPEGLAEFVHTHTK